MSTPVLSALVPTVVGAATLALVLGCQAIAPPSPAIPTTLQVAAAIPIVEWDAADYSFDTPESLPAGPVTIRLTNHGHEPHHAQLLRLNKPLRVTPAEAPSVAAPAAKSTFTMKDFSFEMPDTLPAGTATYELVNAGPEAHELNVLKLTPGTTVQDVLAWDQAPAGPPPFGSVGGINAFDAAGAGFMTLDLQPGTYVAVCRVPDPRTGVAHLHLGMIKSFSVQG